jgi:hypothetical protein
LRHEFAHHCKLQNHFTQLHDIFLYRIKLTEMLADELLGMGKSFLVRTLQAVAPAQAGTQIIGKLWNMERTGSPPVRE